MSDGKIFGSSGGGVAGKHAEPAGIEFRLAPATNGEFNTARLRLIPIACWRVDDVRFAFDSSFVTPDVTSELQLLVRLREAHKTDALYPPLSVFGHADPVGSDDYNKALSGRRAQSVYGLLLSNSDPGKAASLWQDVAGTENWGADQSQVMEATTGLPSGTSQSQLIPAYLQQICPPELVLASTDFLAQGTDAKGKGDYQGCSEFNPLLIFSQEEDATYQQAQQDQDQAVLDERNAANASNRRVVVLLFRPGSQVVATKWPCPRAKEGKAGCVKRFWSDGEARRTTQLPSDRRLYDKTKDTFACRFYDRLSTNSPCEQYPTESDYPFSL